jgi:hypothetical protein
MRAGDIEDFADLLDCAFDNAYAFDDAESESSRSFVVHMMEAYAEFESELVLSPAQLNRLQRLADFNKE